MPASRVCRTCPAIIPAAAYKGRCPDCARQADRARGTKTERGYGAAVMDTPLGTMTYDQCRRVYASRMAAGLTYRCACGCGDDVDPGDWHLGHDALDRRVIVGPMRSLCNLSDAGRSAHNSHMR